MASLGVLLTGLSHGNVMRSINVAMLLYRRGHPPQPIAHQRASPAASADQLRRYRHDSIDFQSLAEKHPTATIGFWQNKDGQQLIAQGGTELAVWLRDNESAGSLSGFAHIYDTNGDGVIDGVIDDDEAAL